MSAHYFVSTRPALLANWASAFEDTATLVTAPENTDGLVWLDSSTLSDEAVDGTLEQLRNSGGRGVVMTATPDADRAAQLMNEGAVGYCHLYAVAGQLRGIALVVENGGVWLPPSLMQRVLGVTMAVLAPADKQDAPVPDQRLELLSAREHEVATEVARGASNREIAERLDVSERTVKAHLSTAFEKLEVRDRVQLALLMNNIKIS